MHRRRIAVVITLTLALLTATASALSSAFTFQGQLQQGGTPTTGQCDVQFGLFSAVSGPGQLGSTQTVSNISVTNGLFVVQLNGAGEFGPTAFNGADRFLELAVRCPAGSGSFTALAPRQPVTAVPYALFAGAVADNAVGSASIVDGTIGTVDLGANAVTSAKITDGSVATADLGSNAVTSAKIVDGTVAPADVSFNFAASTSKGGPASDVACTGCVVNTEVSATGSTSGQVLTSNGTNVLWQNQTLTLPFAATAANSSPLLSIENTGPGHAIVGRAVGNAILGAGSPGIAGLGGAGIGIYAESQGDHGLFATSTNGADGIYGTTGRADGSGVHGEVLGATATGVRGTSSQGTGVLGYTPSGFDGVIGQSDRADGVGVRGIETGTNGIGVVGLRIPPGTTVPYAAAAGSGVFGFTTTGDGVNGVGVVGVRGTSNSSGFAAGVAGGGDTIGVFGSANNYGVYGTTLGSGAGAVGVYGSGAQGIGVHGEGNIAGVQGESTIGHGVTGGTSNPFKAGVEGHHTGSGYGVSGTGNVGGVLAAGSTYGVDATGGSYGVHATGNYGVAGLGSNIGVYANNTNSGHSVYLGTQSLAADIVGPVNASGGTVTIDPFPGTGSDIQGFFVSDGARFYDDVAVDGTVFAGAVVAGAKLFQIDHPLDPANKYLRHACVESPEMKNVYDGTAVLDELGEASVDLPAWFEALNQDFRYQLTAIGAAAPGLFIAEKVTGNRFKIAGGHSGLEVSWQVTGNRHDAYAVAHPIQVETDKPPSATVVP